MTSFNDQAATDAAKWYASNFKQWDVKRLGARPTGEQLLNVHRLGLRPGKQALACAMSLRDTGVTNSQIVIACGAPQLNRMRGLVDDRLFHREPASPGVNNHMVYKNTLTQKARDRIERVAKREADAAIAEAAAVTDASKPAKATKVAGGKKATSKPRKGNGKVTTVEVPMGTAPQLPAPVELPVELKPTDVGTGEPEATVNG
jgi:hypothetical protein